MNKIEQNLVTLLRQLLGGIAAFPDDIEVIIDYSGGTTTEMSLRCNAADMPRILGKAGAHIRAVKEIAAAFGERHDRIIHLTAIRQPVKGEKPSRFPPYRFRPDWPREAVENLARATASALFKHPVEATSEQNGERCRFTIKLSHSEPDTRVNRITPSLAKIIQSIAFTQGCAATLDVERVP